MLVVNALVSCPLTVSPKLEASPLALLNASPRLSTSPSTSLMLPLSMLSIAEARPDASSSAELNESLNPSTSLDISLMLSAVNPSMVDWKLSALDSAESKAVSTSPKAVATVSAVMARLVKPVSRLSIAEDMASSELVTLDSIASTTLLTSSCAVNCINISSLLTIIIKEKKF